MPIRNRSWRRSRVVEGAEVENRVVRACTAKATRRRSGRRKWFRSASPNRWLRRKNANLDNVDRALQTACFLMVVSCPAPGWSTGLSCLLKLVQTATSSVKLLLRLVLFVMLLLLLCILFLSFHSSVYFSVLTLLRSEGDNRDRALRPLEVQNCCIHSFNYENVIAMYEWSAI